jgi:hypothetical protein
MALTSAYKDKMLEVLRLDLCGPSKMLSILIEIRRCGDKALVIRQSRDEGKHQMEGTAA